ncbi:MAG: hypothetical protein H6Q89_2121 [Myxococcaceae bacterium]|nr:hypothetical protein [Myxococcaceae bacterium]
MNALLVTALLLSGADSLTATRVAGLGLKAPSGWTTSDATDGKSWEAPGNEAQMELTVYPVDPKRPAQECLDQLLEKLGKEGWDTLVIGAAPAVRKVTTDYVGAADAGKSDANKVSTVTYVGCNGATKWVLTMSSNSTKSGRFGAVLKAIVGSISYPK